jgi:hypothetical protein
MMKLQFFIDGQKFETTEVYQTGKDLKAIAGISSETDLYLSLKRPYEDELIANDQRVDLSRPETEYFYVQKPFGFVINGLSFNWPKQYITVEELRKVGKVDPEQELYNHQAKVPDLPLTNKERIDLSQPLHEHFVTKKRVIDFSIIINGRIKAWKEETISFDQAVILAFGKMDQSLTRAYTITYSRGSESKQEGIMVKGNEIRVKEKMIFNVTTTDKS